MHSLKKLNAVFSALMFMALPLFFAACKKPCVETTAALSTVAPIENNAPVTVPTSQSNETSKKVDTYIILNDENTTINGKGASFSDSVLKISKGGYYSVKGKLSDGKIIIDSKDSEKDVFLQLDGVIARSLSDSPFSVVSSGRKVHVILSENAVNEFSDSSGEDNYTARRSGKYTQAVLFSKSDLSIEGKGTLKVSAKYKKGIYSEKELSVLGGNINIESADDALGAKNKIAFMAGTLNASGGSNGMRTGFSEGRGEITISGGTIKIESGLNCIQSSSTLTVSGGVFDLTSGKGSTGKAGEGNYSKAIPHVSSGMTGSSGEQTIDASESKAVRAEKSLTVSGGDFTVNSLDDAFFCGGKIIITDGDFDIKTDANAFFAPSTIAIASGNINVEYCAEGIEGKSVYITGGSVFVNTHGYGFGENGNVLQTGGTVVSFGSKSGENLKSIYTVMGGTVFSSGSIPLKQGNIERCPELTTTATFPANTLLAITGLDGKEIFCLSIAKSCKSFWFSGSELEKGKNYKIYSGGINNGVSINGVFYGSQYNPGWLVDTVAAK